MIPKPDDSDYRRVAEKDFEFVVSGRAALMLKSWICRAIAAEAYLGMRPKNIEVTSARVAAIATIGVKVPGRLARAQIKAVCASVLTQAPDKPKKKGSKSCKAKR